MPILSRSDPGGFFRSTMGPPQSNRAVILKTRAYGESDRIVTFLTEHFGKLTGIAKGARNSRRRFVNCLDPFTVVQVHYRTRATSGLVFMDSCDLLAVPGELSDPVKFAYGSYLLELVDQLTVESEPVSDAFELLCDALAALRNGPATPSFLRAFELRLLTTAGFKPSFRDCQRCRERLAGHAWFDRLSGALLCTDCGARSDGLTVVNRETLAALCALDGLAPAEARDVRLTSDVRHESATLLGHWLALHLARPLKSVGLIEAIVG